MNDKEKAFVADLKRVMAKHGVEIYKSAEDDSVLFRTKRNRLAGVTDLTYILVPTDSI